MDSTLRPQDMNQYPDCPSEWDLRRVSSLGDDLLYVERLPDQYALGAHRDLEDAQRSGGWLAEKVSWIGSSVNARHVCSVFVMRSSADLRDLFNSFGGFSSIDVLLYVKASGFRN